ncbi:hypothetical protein CB1_000305027 [Camelus ferus]|nr:hypothetical protein CB1_000305027 [Camelus ferus]
MAVLVPQQRRQGLEGSGAEWTAVGPLSRVQAVVGTEAGGAWTAVATHVTPAWVPTLPTTLNPSQVAMFVEQQLGDQPEGSWAQGTVKRTWLRGLRYQRGVCHLHHLDLNEVTRGGGRAAIIRDQDLVSSYRQHTRHHGANWSSRAALTGGATASPHSELRPYVCGGDLQALQRVFNGLRVVSETYAALAAARLLSPPRDDLLVDTRGARLVHRAAGDELRAPRLADSRTRRSSPPRAPPVAGFPAPGPPAQGSGPGLSALPLSRSTLQPGRRFPSARRSVASIALLVDTTQTFATAPCASVSPPARWEEPPLPTCVSGQV